MDSILEKLIDNRISALKTIVKANGFEENIGRSILDGRSLNFQEPLPHAFWAIDEEATKSGPIGRYARELGLWVGAAIEYAGKEPWRKLARIRADLQKVMGQNFPFEMPLQQGGIRTVQIQVIERGSSEPVLETAGGARGYVQILYGLSYDTSRNDPGVQ